MASWEILGSENAWRGDIQKEPLPLKENQRESWRPYDTRETPVRSSLPTKITRAVSNRESVNTSDVRNGFPAAAPAKSPGSPVRAHASASDRHQP